MTIRPILHGMVNSTLECSCGKEKNIYKQWCEVCWSKIPFRVAQNFSSRSLSLARQIETCNRFIKEYDNRMKATNLIAKDGPEAVELLKKNVYKGD